MTFSNPAGSAGHTATSYVRALLDLLGCRDPLEVMAELVSWVEIRLRGVAEPVLRKPEASGKWSVIQVIQHLVDSDLVAGYHIRMMLSQDRPAIRGYDQAPNLHLWTQLTPHQLEQVGLHAKRGPGTAGHLLGLMSAHDLVHRRQIDRILSTTG